MKPRVPAAPAPAIPRRPVPERALVRLQREALLEPREHLGRRDQTTGMAQGAVERHELDEPHVHLALAGEGGEGVQLILDASRSRTLTFTGAKPAAKAASSPARASLRRPPRLSCAYRAGSRLSRLMLTRAQPGTAQIGGEPRQQGAVGGERDVLDCRRCGSAGR